MHLHHSFSKNHFTQKNNIKIDTIKLLRKENINSLKSRYNYELMYEAFYIANLFYDLNETSKHQNDKSFYILSSVRKVYGFLVAAMLVCIGCQWRLKANNTDAEETHGSVR